MVEDSLLGEEEVAKYFSKMNEIYIGQTLYLKNWQMSNR